MLCQKEMSDSEEELKFLTQSSFGGSLEPWIFYVNHQTSHITNQDVRS